MPLLRTLNAVALTLALFFGFLGGPVAQARPVHDVGTKSVILWVQDVHGKALYWVNDKPCGRAPLSGLAAASSSAESIAVTVIVDSRVPIREMAEIDGLMAKIEPKSVHYYIFNRAYPKMGMSEIIWSSRSVPLPAQPPNFK